MAGVEPDEATSSAEPVSFAAADGFLLKGHLFLPHGENVRDIVLINAATGVAARYYHRYAAFLAAHGFAALTYDYRGIGLSRPADLSGLHMRWADWGRLDCEAALGLLIGRIPAARLALVGHSIGGVLPGYAASAKGLARLLTIGAQYAWPGDYAARQRLQLWWKWHVVMPALTVKHGYFPGRRLGWLEDLPRGVALDWAFRRRAIELADPPSARAETRAGFAAIAAPVLAVGVSDDPLGTAAALSRTLDLFSGTERQGVMLTPEDVGDAATGHFGLFHDRHRSGFWLDTLLWLREGLNPWPGRGFYPPADAVSSPFSALPAVWRAY